MNYRRQFEVIKASGRAGAEKLRRMRLRRKPEYNIEEEYQNLFEYTTKLNDLTKTALESLAEYDPELATKLTRDLHTLATRTLYDLYWREESNA